jgi:hypothetical protein
VEFGDVMGRRKKVDSPPEIEENEEDLIIEGEEEQPPRPYKDHHWSDDGPRYCVYKELPDSVPGTRHFGGFFETENLAFAKHECLEQFESENITTFVLDRAEHNAEIVRHEATKIEPKEIGVAVGKNKDIKDDNTTTSPAEKRVRKPRTRTVKRK